MVLVNEDNPSALQCPSPLPPGGHVTELHSGSDGVGKTVAKSEVQIIQRGVSKAAPEE